MFSTPYGLYSDVPTGVGHSTPYEDPAPYALLLSYLLLSTPPTFPLPALAVEPFSAKEARNDYELPWIMRSLVDSEEVRDLFPGELRELREGVGAWRPGSKALREIKKRVSADRKARRCILKRGGNGIGGKRRGRGELIRCSWSRWRGDRRGAGREQELGEDRARRAWRPWAGRAVGAGLTGRRVADLRRIAEGLVDMDIARVCTHFYFPRAGIGRPLLLH